MNIKALKVLVAFSASNLLVCPKNACLELTITMTRALGPKDSSFTLINLGVVDDSAGPPTARAVQGSRFRDSAR